jgi:ABC-2 type transport system permease protein
MTADRENAADHASSPIRDLGYARYDGALLPHRSRYRVISSRTLALAWGSGLVKTITILGMFPMVICGVVMYLKIKGAQLLQSQGIPLHPALQNPEHWVFHCVYWCQIWFAFAMSLVVAAPAIAEDVRTGAFQFYFARPVSRSHYVGGKLLAVAVLIAVLCAVPGILLALLRVVLAESPKAALGYLPLLAGTIAFTAIYAAVIILPAIALSAATRHSGYAMGGWAAIFFLPWALGEGTAAAAELPLVALVSIPTNLRLLGQRLFGMTPSYDVAWYLPALVLVGVVLLSGVLLWRRLARVEVFS